jgi:hypothetical protein
MKLSIEYAATDHEIDLRSGVWTVETPLSMPA